MTILNYIAKDIKEGEALQEALSGIIDQLWIAGDTARRMVTSMSPENSGSLDLVASCDEHAPTLDLLKKSFTLTPTGGGYKFSVGPLPVTLTFSDVGEYLATRRYAGLGIVIHLTKRVPICAPEFYFAPPTADVSGSELEATPEEASALAELVLFEAALSERMAQRVQANLNKPMSEVLNDANPSPVTEVATD